MQEAVFIDEIKNRFRGYFPVVLDAETGGLNCQTDALLEITAITLKMPLCRKLSVRLFQTNSA